MRMTHDHSLLTAEQERKIARVEKKIQTSQYGAPSSEWIEKIKARAAPSTAVRFKKSNRILRVGHRYERESCAIEGRWVVIQSLWMVSRWGVIAWVCFPLNDSRNKCSWIVAGDFVDAEFEAEDVRYTDHSGDSNKESI